LQETSAALRLDSGEGTDPDEGVEIVELEKEKVEEKAAPNPDGLDERREQFQHLVASGGEVTHDWPPQGTPTWGDWLEVSFDPPPPSSLCDSARRRSYDIHYIFETKDFQRSHCVLNF